MTDTVERTDAPNPIEVVRQWPGSPLDDTQMGMIVGATTGLYAEQRGIGHTVQDLSDLHRLVRAFCTGRYTELKIEDYTRSKEQINADPLLTALNSIRSTLHQTMVRRQKQIGSRILNPLVPEHRAKMAWITELMSDKKGTTNMNWLIVNNCKLLIES